MSKKVFCWYHHLTPEFIGKSIDALEKHSYTTTFRAAFGCDRCIKNKIHVWYGLMNFKIYTLKNTKHFILTAKIILNVGGYW